MNLEMPPVLESKPKPADLDPRPELEPYRAKLKPRDQFSKEDQMEMERLRKLIMQDAGILPKEPEPAPRERHIKRSFLESLGFRRKQKDLADDPAQYHKDLYDN